MASTSTLWPYTRLRLVNVRPVNIDTSLYEIGLSCYYGHSLSDDGWEGEIEKKNGVDSEQTRNCKADRL